ncbi:hypothetical protein F443_22426 [Phytophthora nicotianae P1569]|uniref:DDE Tnp4 domain-containing protein n=1 Tax=Phytophthora nicotianae P1569 TaxID=1317065 RepID=V9DWT4_PHYNI|nr:hypothetical protein F443_22426 [Phytophthora nicotianae P1569]
MPKQSFRQRELSKLRKLLKQILIWREERDNLALTIKLEDELDEMLLQYFYYISSRRYLADRRLLKRAASRLEHYLLFTPADCFKIQFRLSRPYFYAVVGLVKNTSVFRNLAVCVELHLLVTLKFFGTCGNGATPNKLADFFSIGTGTVTLYVQRTVDALVSLRENVIAWPTDTKRRELSSRIKQRWKFPNCVGFVDGTLLPLEFKPRLFGEDYFSRKMYYAVNCLVVCDDKGRILYLNAGWVGSAHDNRIWENSKLYVNRDRNFNNQEYLLGDSAYTPSAVMVPAFKRPPNEVMPSLQEWFNSHLAQARIKAEHTIGMLKGRFQWLKRIRTLISKKEDMKRLIRSVDALAVIHNLVIGDDPPIVEEESSDEEELHIDVTQSDERRQQIMQFLLGDIDD